MGIPGMHTDTMEAIMPKTIIAIGRTEHGSTTTTYAHTRRTAGQVMSHAVRLWSNLAALAAMCEAANIPGMSERLEMAHDACQEFHNYWMEGLNDAANK